MAHKPTQKQQLRLREMAAEFLSRVIKGDEELTYEEAIRRLTIPDAIRDRRATLAWVWSELAGRRVKLPLPELSREELRVWHQEGFDLFWMPPNDVAPLKVLLGMLGHGSHWSAGSGTPDDLPISDPAHGGYWFKAGLGSNLSPGPTWDGDPWARTVSIEEVVVVALSKKLEGRLDQNNHWHSTRSTTKRGNTLVVMCDPTRNAFEVDPGGPPLTPAPPAD